MYLIPDHKKLQKEVCMALKVAIAGTGFMGQQHGSRLSKIEGVEISAITDISMQLAQGLKDKLKVNANCYDSFNKMLASEKLDAVYFCIPPFAHKGEVEKAAAKGINIFLEKPIAISARKAESMVKAIEKAGVISQVGFHHRFRKSVQKCKELIRNGTAGRPVLFEGRFWCNFPGGAWWRDITKSGGQIYEQVIHTYDMGLFLMGRAERATGFMNNLCHQSQKDYTIEDTSAGTIRFENGGIGTITGTNCAVPGRFIFDFRTVFQNLTIDFRSTGDWRNKDESSIFGIRGSEVEREDIVEDGDAYLAESVDFINAIREGKESLTPARCGLESILLVSAVIKSAMNNGKPVTISERKTEYAEVK